MKSLCCAALSLALALLIAGPSVAGPQEGKLDAFEADAVARSGHHYADETSGSGSCLADVVADIFGDLMGVTMMYGGVCSWERVAGEESVDVDLAPRAAGEPLIPFARIDVSGQAVESDVSALDVRAEGGYGPVGIHYNLTRFREDDPADEMDLTRVFALYRMSFGSRVEADLGLGSLTLDGEDTTTRLACSLAVLVCPNEHWGMEFRPAWANGVSDYDLAVMWTWPYASLKAGYRWIDSPDESLDGPYVGLSLRL